MRHASFLGLREDKKAKEVVPEKPAPRPKAPEIDVKISNRDRVIFPDSGITKGELADYYARGRAAACCPGSPTGRSAWCAVRRGAPRSASSRSMTPASFGEHVHHVDVREKDGSVEDYLYVDDADGLLACVQMGTIEFHGWGSLVADVEKPDRMVFDLDPDEGLDFGDVKKAAEDI